MAVKHLNSDVIELLSSGCEINSFERAISELVYNSLDAKSTSIAVRLNIEEDKIQVIDDGFGINYDDMKAIGGRHMTSKRRMGDLSQSTYGFRGAALANIIKISETVKIESRSKRSDQTYEAQFFRGRRTDLKAVHKRPSPGTTVTIDGFLYNLDLKRRCISSKYATNEILKALRIIAVINFKTSLTVRDDNTGELILQLSKRKSLNDRFRDIFGTDDDLTMTKFRDKSLNIRVYVSERQISNKELQFAYVNKKPFKNCQITANVNKILTTNNRDLMGNLKERKYSVFVIDIKCSHKLYDITLTPSKSTLLFTNPDRIMRNIMQCVNIHLNKHNEKPDDRNEIICKLKEVIEKNSNKFKASNLKNAIIGKLAKRQLRRSRSANKSQKAVHHSIRLSNLEVSETGSVFKIEENWVVKQSRHNNSSTLSKIENSRLNADPENNVDLKLKESKSRLEILFKRLELSAKRKFKHNSERFVYVNKRNRRDLQCKIHKKTDERLNNLLKTFESHKCYLQNDRKAVMKFTHDDLNSVIDFCKIESDIRLKSTEPNNDVEIEETGVQDSIDIFNSTDIMEYERIHDKVVRTSQFYTFYRRPSFIPKGLSPILKLPERTNVVCKNVTRIEQHDANYYDSYVYDDFKNAVETMAKFTRERLDNVQNLKLRNPIQYYKKNLCYVKVIGQVDKKYIVTIIKSDSYSHLVLFDQHAVDERIQLENLLKGYKSNDVWNSIDCDPVILSLDPLFASVLRQHIDKFTEYGFGFRFGDNVAITSIPLCLSKKLEKDEINADRFIDIMIREELKLIQESKGNMSSIPKILVDVVNSEACHSAIRFGTYLSMERCQELIDNLSLCNLPFQCAHGRPSLHILFDLNLLGPNEAGKPNLKRLNGLNKI